MNEEVSTPLTMKPAIIVPRDTSTDDYETEDEKQDSDLRLLWTRTMDEGEYKTSATYTKVEVLLLCWKDGCTDLTTKHEVEDLKATFENQFNYHAEIKYLDTKTEQGLQVRVNALVATFVEKHDGPKTLFIVYYAGHGRPGVEYGDLVLFGSVTHGYCLARLLTVAGNHHQMMRGNRHQMLRKSTLTISYGIIQR